MKRTPKLVHHREHGPLLNVDETAAFLAIGRRTVYTLVAAGELPAVRVGERLRFRPEELEAYLDRDR